MKQSTISKQLGVTDAGIECLCKAVAHKEGHAFGAVNGADKAPATA
jgi:hypothetical protein